MAAVSISEAGGPKRRRKNRINDLLSLFCSYFWTIISRMTVRLSIVLPGAQGVLVLLRTRAATGAAAHVRERLGGPVPAVVTKVVEGETLEVRALNWLAQELAIRVRRAGVDAPEAGSSCAEERALALRARAVLAERLIPARDAWPPVWRAAMTAAGGRHGAPRRSKSCLCDRALTGLWLAAAAWDCSDRRSNPMGSR
jgi:hypothetical protein